MFSALVCCTVGGSSDQRTTDAGNDTEVCMCFCVCEFADVYNRCICHTPPFLFCRDTMEITTMRRYRQTWEIHFRPFMSLSALLQTSFTNQFPDRLCKHLNRRKHTSQCKNIFPYTQNIWRCVYLLSGHQVIW